MIRGGGRKDIFNLDREGKIRGSKRWSFLSIILHKLAKSSCVGLMEISS